MGKRDKTIQNQVYIFGKQHHRLWRLKGEVDVVITDSPLYLSLYYGETSKEFENTVLAETGEFNNLNIFLRRMKEYNPKGRYQTEAEAKSIDGEMGLLLDKFGIEYITEPANCEGINYIAELVLNKFNKDLEYGLEKLYID